MPRVFVIPMENDNKNKPRIVVVMQARRGSTRLPDKIMLPLANEPLLLKMYERVNHSKLIEDIVIATTSGENDNEIAGICKSKKINCFRGSENDLLDRHFKAGLEFGADIIVKIPSDCPLIDYRIIDKVVSYYIENSGEFDFVSNLHPATYPDGNDAEVIPLPILELIHKEASLPMEREHTTPFIWERPGKFRIGNVEWETGLDYSMSHRFTIDYPEDYEFIKTVYEELYYNNPQFSLDDILELLKKKPEIKKINEKYAGVNWYRNHLHELKTITEKQTKIL